MTVPPTLTVTITEKHIITGDGSSGGCPLANAIKDAYPDLSHIGVDMMTIRATDKEAGHQYSYPTPSKAQHFMLCFDQGWPPPLGTIHITPDKKEN